MAKASFIVGDPSYFDSGKSRKTVRVVRSICILDHPIPGDGFAILIESQLDAGAGTDNAESVQIIIPAVHVIIVFI